MIMVCIVRKGRHNCCKHAEVRKNEKFDLYMKVSEMKALEEKRKNIQAKIDGKAPLFDENEKGKLELLKRI